MHPDQRSRRSPRSPRPGLAALACRRTLPVLALGLFTLAACGSKSQDDNPGDQPASPKAQVKFKGSDRLLNDFARALELDKGEVCNEFGRYSCTDLVHKVALGGVAAYDQGIFEPLESASVTSPIAAERLALSACITRVDADLTGSAPVIFRDLAIRDGKLSNLESQAVSQAIDTMYRRAVQRTATPGEITALRRLYRDVEARGGDAPARDWAVLTCFSVMTTMEQLFY